MPDQESSQNSGGRAMIIALGLTLGLQTLATMAAFSLASMAPAVALDLAIDGNLIGLFVAAVYGVGILSAVGSVTFIRAYGPARVGQFVMLSVLLMLLVSGAATSVIDGLLGLALAALVMGAGYGATAPISTAVLVPRTPLQRRNLVLSIRQIGVPLGGVLAALVVPVVAAAAGWRAALLLQLLPVAIMMLALGWVRADWDADAKQHRSLRGLWQSVGWRQLLAPLANQAIARLSFTSFCFTGIQLCFVAFLVVQLTNDRQLELVTAARFLALYQIAGVVSRPIWGWLADRLLSARIILIGQGLVITFATLAAGFIDPDWPLSAITVLCIAAGISAAGYTGIAYGEYARLGGARGTEATALGSAAMFAGVLVLPAVFSLITAATGDYLIAYSGLAALAFISALSLALSKPS